MTLWDPLHPKATTSDHIPISNELQPQIKPQNDLRTIPSWVSHHPDFPTTIDQLLLTSKYMPQPDYSITDFHHDIMYSASRHIITHAKNASTTTQQQQQYWTLAAFRHSHNPDHPLLQRSLSAYPYIRQFFIDHICIDKTRLHNHLEQLTTQLTEQRMKEQQERDHNDKKQHTTSNPNPHDNPLQHWLSKWSSKKKQSYNLQITDNDGNPSTTTQHAAQLLHDHWQPKFTATPTNETVPIKHLQPHIQQI